MTQSYADFSAQMALVLDRPELTGGDFEDAERLIGDMVVRAVAAAG
jgi:TetR/AcrR family transcriptional regulator